MKEVLEALAPWPVVQGIVIGLLVAAAGFWAMRRGLQDRNRNEGPNTQPVRIEPAEEALPVRIELTDEAKRLEWAAYQQLHHLEQNSFKIALAMEQLLEAIKLQTKAIDRGNDIKWNSTR